MYKTRTVLNLEKMQGRSFGDLVAALTLSHLADDSTAADSYPLEVSTEYFLYQFIHYAGVFFNIEFTLIVDILNIILPAYSDESATARFTGGRLGDYNLINTGANSFADSFLDLITVCTVMKIANIKGQEFTFFIAICVIVDILVITYAWWVGVV